MVTKQWHRPTDVWPTLAHIFVGRWFVSDSLGNDLQSRLLSVMISVRKVPVFYLDLLWAQNRYQNRHNGEEESWKADFRIPMYWKQICGFSSVFADLLFCFYLAAIWIMIFSWVILNHPRIDNLFQFIRNIFIEEESGSCPTIHLCNVTKTVHLISKGHLKPIWAVLWTIYECI